MRKIIKKSKHKTTLLRLKHCASYQFACNLIDIMTKRRIYLVINTTNMVYKACIHGTKLSRLTRLNRMYTLSRLNLLLFWVFFGFGCPVTKALILANSGDISRVCSVLAGAGSSSFFTIGLIVLRKSPI